MNDKAQGMAPAAAQNGESPQAAVLNMLVNGVMVSRGISAAAELGLADLLAEAPRGVEDLARETGMHAHSLYRLMRVLAGAGLVSELAERRFALTPVGACLRSNVPGSLNTWARFLGKDWLFSRWSSLLGSVKNGKTVFENEENLGFFEWYAQHPDYRRTFDEAMTAMSALVNPTLVAGYDFSGIGSLVDIAGGQGSLLAAILRANPAMKGTLFDMPGVIQSARAAGHLSAPDVASRVELIPGDFFESIPKGRDAYLLKWIIHDWNDVDSQRLLANCRRAMERGKKLLIAEMVVEPGDSLTQAKVMDLMMMSLTGGLERTEAEYRALLEASGFELRRVVPTASAFSVVEALAV